MGSQQQKKEQTLAAGSTFEKWLVGEKAASGPTACSKPSEPCQTITPDVDPHGRQEIMNADADPPGAGRKVALVLLLLLLPALPGFYFSFCATFLCAELNDEKREFVRWAWAFERWARFSGLTTFVFNSRTPPWLRVLASGAAFWGGVTGFYDSKLWMEGLSCFCPK